MKKPYLFIILFLIAFSNLKAQEVKNFSLPNILDDSNFTLNNIDDKKAIVIFFTSTRCPYTRSYKDRILDMVKEYGTKPVSFLLVNAENADNITENMKKEAKAYNLPYLYDKGLTVTNQLGATKTPEAFVIENKLGHYTLKYYGAIDDNPQVADEVTEFYVKSAIDAILNSENLDYNTQKPAGCSIN